eukprot:CAMPEP_0177638998 /NCGR_PEP_ID=MMETSP0447-20121125/5787_1 /TAXON_ID=0 /ORGANISM="Stygamoeba regulata, Strain BSH-02190019" /LENGTH=324 /DNA_ID=CAMNT_0019140997 /DNA_START=53 /DNA_END=1027 /DNA_ORIENTATION=+
MPSDQIISAVSGALGGTTALVLTYPLLTISARQQTRSHAKDASAVETGKGLPFLKSLQGTTLGDLVELIQEETWQKLYSGLQLASVGTALTYGIFYYWYQLFKELNVKMSGTQNLSTVVSLLTGMEAGAVTAILTNPFWVVSTIMQTERKRMQKDSASQGSRSTSQVTRDLFKEEGISGFFRGILPALILTINPAVQYMCFEKLKQYYLERTNARFLTPTQLFVLSAIAKIVATLVTYPYILVKTRMQTRASKRDDSEHSNRMAAALASTSAVLAEVYKDDGLLGFYQGLSSKITQSVLNACILFSTQDWFFRVTKKLLAAKRT